MEWFVCSDIHSFYEQWMAALKKAGFDVNNDDHGIIMCGDLFDRGPDAVKCLELCQNLASRNRLVYIRGNHEDLLEECVDSLTKFGRLISESSYYISNGTVDTIAQFSGISKFDLIGGWFGAYELKECMDDVLSFIRETAVNYYEVGDNIFCHGWIPDGDDWRNASANKWKDARWANGMANWYCGNNPFDKTVFCGHWHCSWGWAREDNDCEEFPTHGSVNFEKCFEPFIKRGIVALDAATAYSGIVNIVRIQRYIRIGIGVGLRNQWRKP